MENWSIAGKKKRTTLQFNFMLCANKTKHLWRGLDQFHVFHQPPETQWISIRFMTKPWTNAVFKKVILMYAWIYSIIYQWCRKWRSNAIRYILMGI